MYNRYVPKEDGTWQKKSVQDTVCPAPPRQQPEYRREAASPPPCLGSDAAGFLRRLIPEPFDTGDLLVVLLLLLIAGDSRENRNTALLTLALYFFL